MELERQQNEAKLKGLLRKKEQDGGVLGSVERNLIKRLWMKMNISGFVNNEVEEEEERSRSGLTPLVTDSDDREEEIEDSTSEEDPVGKMNYKNAAYW